MKCVLCGRKHSLDGPYCRGCKLELDKEKKKKRQADPKRRAVKCLAYRGHVVGLFRKNGSLIPSYLGMSTAGIPKSKLINLDEYCQGYTRDQVKQFKRVVLRCAGA
jgi:hypothetical protein